MANIDDYIELLPLAESLQSEEIKVPYMSVDIYIQEADNLWHWCIDDKDALLSVGMNPEIIESLPVRINALRKAQAIWKKVQLEQHENMKKWKKMKKESIQLKQELLSSFRFAFYGDEFLLKKVKEISKGNTNSDHIMDLLKLATLGDNNRELLSAINFDFSLLKKAEEINAIESELRGMINITRKGPNPEKETRDRLHSTKHPGQTLDGIITQLIDLWERQKTGGRSRK